MGQTGPFQLHAQESPADTLADDQYIDVLRHAGSKFAKDKGMKQQRLTAGLANYGFRKVFQSINQYGIKKGVDEFGLDGFIRHCARLAASTGALSGLGGGVTMIVGIPVDLFNSIAQQFRVTLAILYDRRGSYEVTFDELMSIIALSVGVEAGYILTRAVIEDTAERLLIRMGAKAGGRLIPFVGAVIGGSVNYLFIKGTAASVRKLPL
jgi:hypothetical protein